MLLKTKLSNFQKECLVSIIVSFIYGFLIAFASWSFGFTNFGLDKIISFGIIYYLLDAIIIEWIKSVIRSVRE